MNKAFVKDPEPGEPRCPSPEGCDGIGTLVARNTLCAQLPPAAAARFSGSSYYCPNPSCAIAYFDSWGATAPCTVLRRMSYPKSATAPVCPCFGVTAEEIREEARAGRKARVREVLERAESNAARCQTESPSGASCAVEIRRIFLKHFPAK